MDAALEAAGVTKRFGGLAALSNVDLSLGSDELLAIIGPNGAGKTTLVSVLAGSVPCDAGKIILSGTSVTTWSVNRRAAQGLVRSFQIVSTFPELTARENVTLASQIHRGGNFDVWHSASSSPDVQSEALAQLQFVGLAHRAEVPVHRLSHGERRLLELALVLACKPRVLLLDEPMAGLGTKEAREMIGFIKQLKGRMAVILVEHDMDAVFSLADRVMVLAAGKVVACGPPAEIRADPAVRLAYLGDEDE